MARMCESSNLLPVCCSRSESGISSAGGQESYFLPVGLLDNWQIKAPAATGGAATAMETAGVVKHEKDSYFHAAIRAMLQVIASKPTFASSNANALPTIQRSLLSVTLSRDSAQNSRMDLDHARHCNGCTCAATESAESEAAGKIKELEKKHAADHAGWKDTEDFLRGMLGSKIQEMLVAEDRMEVRGRALEAKDLELQAKDRELAEKDREVTELRAGLKAALTLLWQERATALQQTREKTETIKLEALPVDRVAAVEPQGSWSPPESTSTAFEQQDDEIDNLRREFYHNRSEFSSAADFGGPKREIGRNEEIYRRLTAGKNDEAGPQLVFFDSSYNQYSESEQSEEEEEKEEEAPHAAGIHASPPSPRTPTLEPRTPLSEMPSVQNPEWIVGEEAQAELDRAGITSNKLFAAPAENPFYGIERLPGQRIPFMRFPSHMVPKVSSSYRNDYATFVLSTGGARVWAS